MSVLEIVSDIDYSVNDVFDVNAVSFTNSGGSATAVFRTNQVDNVQLTQPLLISGSSGINALVFNGGSLSVFDWAFDLWGAEDRLTVNGGASGDVLEGLKPGGTVVTVLNGLGGADVLTGHGLSVSLYGGAGDDTLTGVAGMVDGGKGVDLFRNSSESSKAGYAIDIADGGGGRYIGGGVRLAGIDRLDVTGTEFADRLGGGAYGDALFARGGRDLLLGRAGNDWLQGGVGNDRLDGGDGLDILAGDAGADRFQFIPSRDLSLRAAATDRITDFEPGRDKIDLYPYALDPMNPEHDHIVFVGETAFNSIVPAQLRYEHTARDTIIEIGRHADIGQPVVYRIILSGILDLTSEDFIL